MKLSERNIEIFVPNPTDRATALARTTDLCIAAHQDDIETMAFGPIAACYGSAVRHFTGVVVTDGGGSPRSGVYADYSDEDMKVIRIEEQKNAARIGRYSAQIFLAHSSKDVKQPVNRPLVDELKNIITACTPDVLYTHNLADKHDTHVALALQVIRALRELPAQLRPKKTVAMEVWRGLDWLNDEDKEIFDTSAYPNIAAALIGLFDSQVSGGKRYDLAAQGRWLANATFFASHAVDAFKSASFGLDMTDLVNSTADPAEFIGGHIDKFKQDVLKRIAKF